MFRYLVLLMDDMDNVTKSETQFTLVLHEG